MNSQNAPVQDHYLSIAKTQREDIRNKSQLHPKVISASFSAYNSQIILCLDEEARLTESG